jgi:hypothetical protein
MLMLPFKLKENDTEVERGFGGAAKDFIRTRLELLNRKDIAASSPSFAHFFLASKCKIIHHLKYEMSLVKELPTREDRRRAHYPIERKHTSKIKSTMV